MGKICDKIKEKKKKQNKMFKTNLMLKKIFN